MLKCLLRITWPCRRRLCWQRWLRWLILRLWVLGLLCVLLLLKFLLLLLRLGEQPFFNIAKVRVLEPSKLFELRRPRWSDVANLAGGRGNGASDKILVCVHQLVVLQAQQHEVVDILLNKLGALVVLDMASTELIFRIENTLCHKYFNNIEKGWVGIQVEA